jgi:hypothetical protein
MGISCLLMSTEVLNPHCCARAQDQDAKAEAQSKTVAASENGDPKTASPPLFADPPAKDASHENSLGMRLLRNIGEDQKAIWTSPSRLRLVDADWLIPLGVATGGFLATDTEYSKHLSNSPSRLKHSNDLSNYGIAAMAAAGGGFYFWGQISHDDHRTETGFLAGEAAIDSYGVTSAFKYAFGRERPLADNYQGKFWQGGSSFPSEHAAAAWSIASVIAHEYPGPLTTLLAYGAASAVSASRITAKQHFPSDVLIGSAIGWFVGQHVYRAHHDPELGGGDWETYAESHDEGPGRRSTSIGSPYVTLDSWIYPAIERLAALGYIDSEFLGMRPWTRIECARLVQEAGDKIHVEANDPPEVNRLYETLAKEFETDLDALAGGANRSARLESIYTRSMGIDGQPLHDSYHFGQTIINDFGRPYQEGFNNVTGFSGWGTAGRFTIYVRGEYQHAPSAPAYSDQIRNVIASVDSNPVQPATPFSTINQFRLLDTYVSANLENWNLSFGKQSLWWGPDYGSAMLFSDNAEPIYIFRASRITPFTLPWIFHWLGPMKFDFFMGKLSGHEFPPRPLIHGEKISFKPTPNLELGFSRTTVFAGGGHPMTLGLLIRTYFSLGDNPNQNRTNDPGDRKGGLDFSYRVPHLRNWLTLYMDSFSDDDPSPLANPPRANFNPGFYMPKLPWLPKVDLRVEAVYTDPPTPESHGGNFVYFNTNYHDSYTNKKYLLGSWIGREGQGFQAWNTYWLGARNSIQLGYRHAKVSDDFIPGGETLNDGSVKVNWWLGRDINLSTYVQYEKWRAPILAPSPQTNWTASVQVGFWPRSWSK